MFGFLKKKKVDPRAKLIESIGTYDLPSFPAVVMRALRVIRSPDGTIGEVGDIIASDPNLSVRVLKLANSAGSPAGRRIGNVRHAVSMAGLANVESMVLGVGVQAALPTGRTRGFEGSRFWRAAARRAATARAFAQRLHPARAMESFTAALLQDMAVPLLAHKRGDDYGELLQAWHGGEDELHALEHSAFGWHHGDVATWVCNEWELSEDLAAMIGSHHGGDEDCPAGVTLVGYIRETHEAPDLEELVEVARARYGVPSDESVAAVNEGFGEGDELARMFA